MVGPGPIEVARKYDAATDLGDTNDDGGNLYRRVMDGSQVARLRKTTDEGTTGASFVRPVAWWGRGYMSPADQLLANVGRTDPDDFTATAISRSSELQALRGESKLLQRRAFSQA